MEDEYRNRERDTIYSCCASYGGFGELSDDERQKLVRLIERSILNRAIDNAQQDNVANFWEIPGFVDIYSNVGYRVNVNLDMDSSVNCDHIPNVASYLISRLVGYMLKKRDASYTGEVINPMQVAYLDDMDLNPYINRHIVDQIAIRGEQRIEVKYSTMYKCGKCGEKRVHCKEWQSRCSDEGSTLYITCLECGHEWKIN